MQAPIPAKGDRKKTVAGKSASSYRSGSSFEDHHGK